MKYLNKITSGLFLAVLGVLTLTGCEGGDLYSVGSPSWLNDKVDSIANSKKTTIVSVTPNPTELGTKELTQDWWSVFTDDIKIEPATSAQVKLATGTTSSSFCATRPRTMSMACSVPTTGVGPQALPVKRATSSVPRRWRPRKETGVHG